MEDLLCRLNSLQRNCNLMIKQDPFMIRNMLLQDQGQALILLILLVLLLEHHYILEEVTHLDLLALLDHQGHHLTGQVGFQFLLLLMHQVDQVTDIPVDQAQHILEVPALIILEVLVQVILVGLALAVLHRVILVGTPLFQQADTPPFNQHLSIMCMEVVQGHIQEDLPHTLLDLLLIQ